MASKKPKPSAKLRKAKAIEWRERLIKIERMPASALLDHPFNPKIHPDSQKEPLAGLLSEVGKVDILKAYLSERNEGALTLWDGHCRRELRPDEMWNVGIYDLTDDEADLLLATFDPIGWQAEQSKQRLESLMDTIKAGNSHVASFLAEQGARLGIINQLNGHHQEGAGGDDFDTTPEETQTRVQYGDLWECGAHRVLCGDSTKAEDVAKVMAGEKAAMCFTDPPWNVAIGKDSNPRHRQRQGLENDDLSPEDFRDFLQGFMRPLASILEGDLYCVLGASEWPSLDSCLRAEGFHWSATVIWVKDQFVLGRSKYHRRYEPIWYGWHAKGKSSFSESAGRDKDDVWEIPRPRTSEEHPTMKPVELVERAVSYSSEPRSVIYEPFGGAGSTLIACERTNRKARVIEIEPKYVNVILSRWEAETGKKARKVKR